MKNYFLAARFAEHPDLHLTICFYKDTTEEQLEELIKKVESQVMQKPLPKIKITFDRVSRLGKYQNVRALTSATPLPAVWTNFRLTVPGNSGFTTFIPHVTSKDADKLTLEFTSLAIMHKKSIINEWLL